VIDERLLPVRIRMTTLGYWNVLPARTAGAAESRLGANKPLTLDMANGYE
jgi:hypothetical protein